MKPSPELIGSLATLLAAACVTTTSEKPRTRPLSTAELEMGYQEAVDLGSRYVADQGYAGAELHRAERIGLNLWRVRFGLAPKGSGRVLDLYFDGARRLVKTEELTDKESRPSKTKSGQR